MVTGEWICSQLHMIMLQIINGSAQGYDYKLSKKHYQHDDEICEYNEKISEQHCAVEIVK